MSSNKLRLVQCLHQCAFAVVVGLYGIGVSLGHAQDGSAQAPSLSDMASVAPAGTQSIEAYGVGVDIEQATQEARAGTVEEAIIRIIGPDALLTHWKKITPLLDRANDHIRSEFIVRSVKSKEGTYTVKLRTAVDFTQLQQLLLKMKLWSPGKDSAAAQ